jgi:hypothetical protein
MHFPPVQVKSSPQLKLPHFRQPASSAGRQIWIADVPVVGQVELNLGEQLLVQVVVQTPNEQVCVPHATQDAPLLPQAELAFPGWQVPKESTQPAQPAEQTPAPLQVAPAPHEKGDPHCRHPALLTQV